MVKFNISTIWSIVGEVKSATGSCVADVSLGGNIVHEITSVSDSAETKPLLLECTNLKNIESNKFKTSIQIFRSV